jgi:hypothetical protein
MTRCKRFAAATGRIRCEFLLRELAMIRWLLTTFIAVAVLSSCWPWLRKIGIGRLPGDVTLRVFGREYPFPFMSTLVLSMVLSIVARLL